ncbi:MAG: ribonuclease domain-containing protein [Marmoricola sp.]
MNPKAKAWGTLLLAVVLCLVWAWQQGLIGGSSSNPPVHNGVVAEADLPSQARDTLARIDARGPFKFDQDGATFENREGLLPKKPRGYYHEYTVITPGSPDRGPRRIVTGASGEYYWTQDHYRSFEVIRRQ